MKLKIVGILGLLVLLILVGCSSPTPIREVTLKLNWLPGAQFIGYFVAQDQGFYAEENLELTIEALNDSPEGRDILTGVLDGDYDFAIGVADLIRAQSEGANLTVFSAIVQLGPGVLFARADSGIKTPREFAGQTVAITSDTGRSNIEKLLLLNGLSLEDIEQVPASFDMTPFYDGEVVVWGGYLSDEVIRVRQNGIEVVTFPLYEYGIEGGGYNDVYQQKFAKRGPGQGH